MSWRRFFRRRQNDAELRQEMELHLAEQIEENLARGMSPEEARRQAFLKFGNAQQIREDLWLQNTFSTAADFWRDLKYAARTLSRTPGFSVTAVLVMTLGIGANLALFSIVRSVLLKPLPFKDPSQLVRLYEVSSDRSLPYRSLAGGVFAQWKSQNHSFSDMALFRAGLAYSLSESGGQLPEKVTSGICSWNFFSTLGVEPVLGRGFSAGDDQPSANGVALLSWGLWQRRFGGDPAILNQTIRLDAKPYTVVGVLPSWFTYPQQNVQLWTPIYHEIRSQQMELLDQHDWSAIGRLQAGATQAQATTELSLIVERLHRQHLDMPFISGAANSRPLLDDLVGGIKAPLYLLLGATGCLLLMACLNSAGLLLARGAARQKELAIRAALGGSKWRLLREHLTESLLLSSVSGALGLPVASAALRWFVSARQDITRIDAIHIDGMSIAFAAGLIVLSAIFAGITSSLSIKSDQILSSLQDSSRSHSNGSRHGRLRMWLLSLEVGLTVVLLVAAGLLFRSYGRLHSVDLGSITKNVLTMQFSLPDKNYPGDPQRMAFFSNLLERVRSIPGAQAAALVRVVPGQGYPGDVGFTVVGRPPLPLGKTETAIVLWADPGYFKAMGIPLLRGASFADGKRLDKANEVILSKTFARQYFHDEDPIGKQLITLGQQTFQVVGVVGDTRHTIAKDPEPTMYFSIYGGTFGSAALVVRSISDVNSLSLPIQQAVQQMDPELAVMDILTMNQIAGRKTLEMSFDATLLLVFAGLSLSLAAAGLFGVLSYTASQRTTEIGIRIALGAQRKQVMRMMLGDGLRPAFIGLVLGLLASIGVTRLIQSMLYRTAPLDPSVIGLTATMLLLVAAAACFLPAWRSSRLDPMQTLRGN